MTESLIRPRPRRWGWLIPTCLVAVVWSLVSTLGAPANMPDDAEGYRTSYLLGSIAGSIALVFAVMLGVHAIVFLRKSGQELVGRHALFILGAAVLGAVPALALTFGVAMSAGKNAEYRAFRDSLRTRVDAKVVELRPRLEASIGQDVLGPAALASPGGLERARSGLEEAREIFAEMDTFLKSETESARLKIAELETNPENELAQFDEIYAPYSDGLDRMWTIQYQIIDTWEVALDILSRTPRRWEVQNGQFVFYREDDLAAFNEQMQKIDTLEQQAASEQAAMQALPRQ